MNTEPIPTDPADIILNNYSICLIGTVVNALLLILGLTIYHHYEQEKHVSCLSQQDFWI